MTPEIGGDDVPPAVQARSRMPRTARRRQLLRAAQAIFVAQGYHGAAMDDIAVRAGVTKPVLYQHFPGKLELYLALLDEQIDGLIERIRAGLGATSDNQLRVEGAVSAYFDFVDSETGAFRLLFESDANNDPAVRARVRGFLRACVGEAAAVVAEDTGVPDERASLLAAGLIGLAESSARWWLENRGSVDRADAVAMVAALAWRGISAVPRHPVAAEFTDGVAGGDRQSGRRG